MKILELSFSNINSLKGQWTIDFTDPAFDDGILALTGSTGSGKTSILDAVCLALYGRTPRISSVTEAQNEVMNRQSSECSAELIFEVGGKLYRAGWSQQRKKKNNESKPFKPVQTFLEERENDGWITKTGKIKEKDLLITEITGLNFDQFTRSVLLAQGDFSAFLKSEEKSKAAILEQLTGTTVYRAISQRVFETHKTLKAQLAELRVALEQQTVLSDEDLAELTRQEKALQSDLIEIRKEKEKTQENEKNLATFEQFGRALAQAQTQLKALHQAEEAVTSKRTALAIHRKGEIIRPIYTELERLQKEKVQRDSNIKIYRTRCAEDLNSEEKTKCSLRSKKNELEKLKVQETESEVLFREVEQIDQTLSGLTEPVKDAIGTLSREQAKLTKERNSRQSAERSLTAAREKHARIGEQLNAIRRYAPLSEKETALNRLKDEFLALETHRFNKEQEIAEQNREADERKEKVREAKDALSIAEKEQTEATRQTEKMTELHAGLLNGRSFEAWKQKIELAMQEENELAGTAEYVTLLQSKETVIEQKQNAFAQRKSDLADKENQKERSEATLSGLGRAETALQTLVHINQMVTERLSLKDGEPCPLCGALDHPFAAALPDGVLQADLKLKQTQKQIKKEEQHFQQLIAAISKLQGAQETDADEIERLNREKDQMIEKVQTRLDRWQTTFTDSQSARALIENLSRRNQEEKRSVQAMICRIESAADQLEAAKSQGMVARSKAESAKQNLLNAEQNYAGAKNKCAERTREGESLNRALEAKKLAFITTYAGFIPSELSQITSEWIKGLLGAVAEYKRVASENERIEQEIDEIQTRKADLTTRIDELEKSVASFEDRFRKLSNQQNSYSEKRNRLFGTRSVAIERAQLRHTRDLAEAKIAEEEARLQSILMQKADNAGALSRAEADRNKICADLSRQEAQWLSALEEKTFRNTDAWTSSRLTASDTLRFEEAVKVHESEILKAQSAVDHNEGQIRALRPLIPQGVTLTELRERKNRLEDEQNRNLEQTGQLREKKKQDEGNRRKADELRKQIEALTADYIVWDRLNALIGSSDGSKYNKYVQSLMMGYLLESANKELAKLRSRFRLTTEKGKELNISVIDEDLAGQVRPASNLSGGETFIVSLALALGLSKMASQNVRIDSLFLDEGFGTLDDQSLENALSALGSINAQGKLVCIISHVQQIKDRIPVRINVLKASEPGVSRLEGAGVSGSG